MAPKNSKPPVKLSWHFGGFVHVQEELCKGTFHVGGQFFMGEMFRGKCLEWVSISHAVVQVSTVMVLIWTTLVNTHTHRQAAFDWLYYKLNHLS